MQFEPYKRLLRQRYWIGVASGWMECGLAFSFTHPKTYGVASWLAIGICVFTTINLFIIVYRKKP